MLSMEAPEKAVCCTLCLCMAVAVLSSVSLVYLTAIGNYSTVLYCTVQHCTILQKIHMTCAVYATVHMIFKDK
jgi:hypothetical protein